jgi:hypothetical protein
MSEQSFNVQAAPNESKIQGKIVKINKDTESMSQVWDVKIEKSVDVKGMPNFTKSRLGNSVKIYLPLDIKGKFKKGDLIEASVTFQGDEAGGVFFAVDDEIQKVD